LKTFQLALSAPQLMAKSRALSGTDIIDSSIEEALTRLIQSLNIEAQLHEKGAIAWEKRLLRLLCNRLRMQRDFAAHPEINDQKIIGPLWLTGGPRTGSTKLHKMLAASGDFLYLKFWQGHELALRSGDRNEDPAPRINDADDYVRWIAENAPQGQLNHGYGTFEPEEESLILEHFICSTFPSVFAFIPSYLQWWGTQDFRKQVEFLKQGLQYLQWQFHDGDPRPWLLKCPIYHGLESVMAEVFPDVVFVTTNRHPTSSVASTANLVQGCQQACSDADQSRVLGPAYLEGLATTMQQHFAVRDNHPDMKFLDIGYTELTQNAEQVVEKIYAHAGLPLSAKARHTMLDWEKESNRQKPGAPKYSSEDYALTNQMISDRFDFYIERFGRYF
jgi:LPS sulfotransferase NodH